MTKSVLAVTAVNNTWSRCMKLRSYISAEGSCSRNSDWFGRATGGGGGGKG